VAAADQALAQAALAALPYLCLEDVLSILLSSFAYSPTFFLTSPPLSCALLPEARAMLTRVQ